MFQRWGHTQVQLLVTKLWVNPLTASNAIFFFLFLKLSLKIQGFALKVNSLLFFLRYVSERIPQGTSKHHTFFVHLSAIPYWVTSVAQPEGRLSIIAAKVNSLRRCIRDTNPSFHSNTRRLVLFALGFSIAISITQPSAVAWMPLDELQSWLICGFQTSALVINSTWSFSWQVPSHQCKKKKLLILNRREGT